MRDSGSVTLRVSLVACSFTFVKSDHVAGDYSLLFRRSDLAKNENVSRQAQSYLGAGITAVL